MKIYHLLILLFALSISIPFQVNAQCLADIAAGNGSFNDDLIGWSSPTSGASVPTTLPTSGASNDGGKYLRIFTSGASTTVNIPIDGLTIGGIYEINWEVIHGDANTYQTYLTGGPYTVSIKDGSTVLTTRTDTLTDPTTWIQQSISFTANNTNLVFEIFLDGADFNNGTYKMGIDGLSINCNGTTRPCDLVAPSFQKSF